MTFSDLGLAPALLRAIEATGYTTPTPVQAQAVPEALAGRDLLVTLLSGAPSFLPGEPFAARLPFRASSNVTTSNRSKSHDATLKLVLEPTVAAFAWTVVSMLTPVPSTVATVRVMGRSAIPSGACA